MTNKSHYKERISFGKIEEVLEFPNLLDIQKQSFDWLIGNDDFKKRVEEAIKNNDFKFDRTSGLEQVFNDVSPIISNDNRYVLTLSDPQLGECEYTPQECREKSLTYEAPLYVRAELEDKEEGNKVGQTVQLGYFPLMTENCTFIYSGVERVIISQIQRSPGVYFSREQDKKTFRWTTLCKIIPARGSWLEVEIDKKEEVKVRIDRKKRQNIIPFLMALCSTKEDLEEGFDFGLTLKQVEELAKSSTYLEGQWKEYGEFTIEEARRELASTIRPHESATANSGRSLLFEYYFNPERYDLTKIGRYKIEKKFNPDIDTDKKITAEYLKENKILTGKDLMNIIRYIIAMHEGKKTVPAKLEEPNGKQLRVRQDDIDHFGNRRIRQVGEQVQNSIRLSFIRIQRSIRNAMATQAGEDITPLSIINGRPLTAALREFYGQGELSQFMDQNNPLSALSHRRRLSALGKGGLTRDRAKVEVRDVHKSHYGRICPIESPEGQNIGLIAALATYAKVNGFGFIETPYRKVKNGKVTNEIVYLSADSEENYNIAQANVNIDKDGKFVDDYILARNEFGETEDMPKDEIQLIDVIPRQMISVGTSLIPFLEHDDANRALMGANMQRQAVPLLKAEAPLVGTGVEYRAAKDTGDVVLAKRDGVVREVDSTHISVDEGNGKIEKYNLRKFWRTNQDTVFSQKPTVKIGEKVSAGDPMADGSAIENSELAIGKNLLVAYMNWEGYNFEDAIIISQRLVSEDVLTSISIEEHECVARETNLGDEEITRDLPDYPPAATKDLGDDGIIRVGAEVESGDLLVGKVSPTGENELTPEEKLLTAIFSHNARRVRETSLKMPRGERGIVIGTKSVKREDGVSLDEKVLQRVKVFIAQKRKIAPGDKLSGRHGNKGVISRVLPPEDMPFLEDGTPVDIILNPLGVPSRMNLGQVLEVHLGWIAKNGWDISKNKEASKYVPEVCLKGNPNQKVATPSFDGMDTRALEGLLEGTLPNTDGQKLVDKYGKADLYDGRTGKKFPHKISVGYMYILKLHHLVEDKIHARSTGPYSLVTNQPLGGKAQFGGQRFGEMEVWALEAYGAAYTLNEMMTIKSDDVNGRERAYSAIVRKKQMPVTGIPESFRVLYREMQGVGLDMRIHDENGNEVSIVEDYKSGVENFVEEQIDEDKVTISENSIRSQNNDTNN